MTTIVFVESVMLLILGAAAGYLLNRSALFYLKRYGEEVHNYSGLVGICCNKKTTRKHIFSADMIAVEVAASLLSAAAAAMWGLGAELLFLLPIIYLILLLSLIDGRTRMLPDQLNAAGISIGLGYALFRDGFGLGDAFLGMAAGAGIFLASAFFYVLLRRREGLGMGDVKLLAFFGTFAGWQGVLFIIVLGSFLGAFWGIFSVLREKRKGLLHHEIPFGPFLGAAALVRIFFF
jgi:leader peptidase (prepilin peptidase)/N-methyltransferase